LRPSEIDRWKPTPIRDRVALKSVQLRWLYQMLWSGSLWEDMRRQWTLSTASWGVSVVELWWLGLVGCRFHTCDEHGWIDWLLIPHCACDDRTRLSCEMQELPGVADTSSTCTTATSTLKWSEQIWVVRDSTSLIICCWRLLDLLLLLIHNLKFIIKKNNNITFNRAKAHLTNNLDNKLIR